MYITIAYVLNSAPKHFPDCSVAAPDHGTVGSPTIIHGSSTNYACKIGYSLIGDTIQSCSSGKLTAKVPTCDPGSKIDYALRQTIQCLHYSIYYICRHLEISNFVKYVTQK